ncbi:HutD family protein [Arthrobacter sp. GCM10027362]|uniref:HutD/Ves family protein n=1 Tax=Arthrobacter sp. GCM10027362 TaxID=3273379 RepID=UPI00362BF88F
MTATHYVERDYAAMPWKNGRGTTTELARDTADQDYGWRLSIADIAEDGEFSAFTGMQRVITVLEGAGMRLSVDGVPSGDLRPFEAYAFDGGSRTSCALLDGPVRDFNLIYRPDRFSARFEWLAFPGSRRFITTAATVLVYCSGRRAVIGTPEGGQAQLGNHELLRLDNTSGTADISIQAPQEGRCAVVELWRY